MKATQTRLFGILIFIYACFLIERIFSLNFSFVQDDTFITLRYVQNFLAGNGIVWSVGERVQGYTNFLDLMLIAILGRLGMDLLDAARLIGVFAYLGCCFAILYFFRRRHLSAYRSPLWYLPALVVSIEAPLIVWVMGGLEGPLFSFFVALGTIFLLIAVDSPERQGYFIASGNCFGLACLTRPDGFIYVFISCIWILFVFDKGQYTKKNFISFVLPIAAIGLPYLIWAYAYYGSILPNTFYAKGDSISLAQILHGAKYVFRFILTQPYLPILTLYIAASSIKSGGWKPKQTYLITSILVFSLYVIAVGGDFMQVFRFMLPVIVQLSILLGLCLPNASVLKNQYATILLPVFILFLGTAQLFSSTTMPRTEDPAAYVGTIVGKYVSKSWAQGSLVALNTAGSTPYFAPGFRYIDMLGINDRHIARRKDVPILLRFQSWPGHRKGDGAYVLSRHPDYIILGPAEGRPASQPWFLSDLEISRNQQFYKDYELHTMPLDTNGDPVAYKHRFVEFTYYKRKHAV